MDELSVPLSTCRLNEWGKKNRVSEMRDVEGVVLNDMHPWYTVNWLFPGGVGNEKVWTEHKDFIEIIPPAV